MPTKNKNFGYCNICPFAKSCGIDLLCANFDYEKTAGFAFDLKCALTKIREMSHYEFRQHRIYDYAIYLKILKRNLFSFLSTLRNCVLASLKYDTTDINKPFLRAVYKDVTSLFDDLEIGTCDFTEKAKEFLEQTKCKTSLLKPAPQKNKTAR